MNRQTTTYHKFAKIKQISRPNRLNRTSKITMLALELVMVVICLGIILPFVFAVLNSFKTSTEASRLNFTFPTVWKFDNYITVVQEGRIIHGFLNSCMITLASVVFIIIAASLASFVLGRKEKKYISVIYMIFVAGLIPPPFAIPTVKIMHFLGLNSTFPGIILFYCSIYLPFTIFLITGFIKTVPRELDEAAVVEGCNAFVLFFKIIFPLLKPVIATATVFCFMFIWNDFTWPLYLLNDSNKWTIPLTVFNFVSKYGTQWELVFADLIIAAMPVLILYFSAQELIIEGMTAGAVKG